VEVSANAIEERPMIRRLLVPLLGSGLLLNATAGSALAKCEMPEPKPAFCSEIIVGLRVSGGGMVQAGTRESLLVDISQGEQPFAATSVLITLLDADGTTLWAPAAATSQPGNWTAEVTLPDGGSWRVTAHIVGANGGTYELAVNPDWGNILPALPPAKAPTSAPTTAPPVTPASPVLPIALVLGALAAAAVAGQVIRDRSRRRAADAGVAAGNAATADRASAESLGLET
jgi:hypothetical protein